MSYRLFPLFGTLAIVSTILAPASVADASSRDRQFFESVGGLWSGPGEIVAGKYKGTKFTCNLTGEPAAGKSTGIKLDGTCRVGMFSQPMSAVISQNGSGYSGQFLDGAAGKGLDIVSGSVTGDKVVMGINRAKLNGAMVARLADESAMHITISVKVEDRMVPVIGLKLNRKVDPIAVGSISK